MYFMENVVHAESCRVMQCHSLSQGVPDRAPPLAPVSYLHTFTLRDTQIVLVPNYPKQASSNKNRKQSTSALLSVPLRKHVRYFLYALRRANRLYNKNNKCCCYRQMVQILKTSPSIPILFTTVPPLSTLSLSLFYEQTRNILMNIHTTKRSTQLP